MNIAISQVAECRFEHDQERTDIERARSLPWPVDYCARDRRPYRSWLGPRRQARVDRFPEWRSRAQGIRLEAGGTRSISGDCVESRQRKATGHRFVSRGYTFLVPHRRGQGRSPGAYIMDQLNAATSPEQRSLMLVALNEVHLQDQLGALAYLRSLPYVDQNRLVVMGASFGGIQTMLAVERRSGYRVAVDCSGAAQTWRGSPDLRARLTAAASKATIPVFFLQAENDYDLTPNRVLSEEVRKTGKSVQTKTYPAFGSGAQEGHSFCWRGTDIWGPDVLKFIQDNLR